MHIVITNDDGFVSITPIHQDMTDYRILEEMKKHSWDPGVNYE